MGKEKRRSKGESIEREKGQKGTLKGIWRDAPIYRQNESSTEGGNPVGRNSKVKPTLHAIAIPNQAEDALGKKSRRRRKKV